MRLDIENVLEGLSDFEAKAKKALDIYGDSAGKKLEKEAKTNAPWIDRTGLSRKTIEGGKQWDGSKCVTYVSGNTAHFPYLELAHDKKYAILQPTIDECSPGILRGLNNLLER